MISTILLAFILAQSKQYLVRESSHREVILCLSNVCNQPEPRGDAGFDVSGSVLYTLGACVTGGTFTGAGRFETWTAPKGGGWAVVAGHDQPLSAALGAQCVSWSYKGSTALGRVYARARDVGVTPGANLAIKITKYVEAA